MDNRMRIYQLALRTFTPQGTLAAAAELLGHVADCGFTHVQLTPVCEMDNDTDVSHWSVRQVASGMNNPNNNYRLGDYYRIDSEYGTEEDLETFVRCAHAHGLRVILDIVYYHCSRLSTLVREHPDYLQHDGHGEILIGDWNTPLPDYANPELCRYMWENMEYFIRRFDVDGYRCDVGDRVPHAFWQEGIRRCRALKPDFFMLNEGEKIDYLDIFDCNYFSSCCYSAREIASGEKTAQAFQDAWQSCRERIPRGRRLLHFVENHDVVSDSFDRRFEKVYGHRAMEVQLALIYTLDGVPFVFNGNELADDAKHSLFSSRFHGRDDTLLWQNLLTEAGRRRLGVIRRLNRLRDEEPALNTDALEWVEHDAPEAVLAFTRPGENGAKSVLAVLNLRGEPVTVCTSLRLPGLESLAESGAAIEGLQDGLRLAMQGYGYLIAAIG